jgi:two-component system response regulator HydG
MGEIVGITSPESLSLEPETSYSKGKLAETLRAELIGRSPGMHKVREIIARVSDSTHPVLIEGETGTGKDLVARAIHSAGPHCNEPFIPVDCGSLVPTLIESELFGHARGAFTGAVGSKNGLMAAAGGGTVFLDEIGELPVELQSRLLRALQEKEVRPVGSTRSVALNARMLAATNRDLEAAVSQGAFRKDLYFRLNVVTLRIPPLRERKQDIPLLASHFFQKELSLWNGAERTISEEAMRLMLAYDWPGNVRELENFLEGAAVLNSSPALEVADLPSHIRNPRVGSLRSFLRPASEIVPIAELEKQAILSALDSVNGDKLLAAELLGIGKTTLYRKLQEYGSNDSNGSQEE